MRLHVGVQEVRSTEAVRGIPQGSLHEGGGPQGPSSALRSMVPSAVLHAKIVTTNRLGGKGGVGKWVEREACSVELESICGACACWGAGGAID